MSSLNRVGAATSTAGSAYAGHCKPHDESVVPDEFPVGLRVLVVDDDIVCLKIVEKTLQRCRYTVTTCSQATVALKLLREYKNGFDVVLSDVHMPDMDGYKLLELVGLEMDLPVIMMSADTRTSAVMRGVKHGACDYLIKPIREAELKNIWQHVLRKKWVENKSHEHSGSFEESDWHKRGSDEAEYNSSANDTPETVKLQKKRNPSKEEDDIEPENDDSSAAKKPRVVWSVELHQQFVSAVNQLGIDKAVPKRILELMNVPGLTRENVASHLQKFRLYLKRLSGVAQHAGMNPFCGVLDSSAKLPSMGRLDIHALVASGQIPPQTLAALQADLLGRSPVDPSPKLIQSDHAVSYGQPLKPHTKAFSQEGTWASPSSSYPSINFQNNIYHQQPSINVQPSCMAVPSHSVNYPNCVISNSFDDSKGSMVARYANNASSSSFSPVLPNDAVVWTGQTMMKQSEYIPATYCVAGGEYRDEGGLMSMGHVARGGSVIPSRFAVDEMELQSMGHVANGNKVKQEPDLDGSRGSIALFQQFSANDLMSVFTE